MALPIDIEELKRLVHDNKIDKKFAFIKNPQVMYFVIKENPNLVNLLDYDTGERVVFQFKIDQNITKDLRKTLFKHLIKYYDIIPDDHLKLIETEQDYLEIASSNIHNYMKLVNSSHPFKKMEEVLFYELYEDKYIFNPSLFISYAKKSSKVLLNTLKIGTSNMYYLKLFDKEAFTDEVIEYLEKNNLIDRLDKSIMAYSPKLVLIYLKKDSNLIFDLAPVLINEEIIKYLESINFNIEMINDYISKHNQLPACLNSSKVMLLLLRQSLDNIKYLTDNVVSQEVFNYLNENNYLYQPNHNVLLLQDNNIFKRFIDKKENLLYLMKSNISLNEEQIKIIKEFILKKNIDFINIKNNSLITNREFAKFLCQYGKIPNPYNLEYTELITNIGSSLPKLQKIFSNNDIQIIIRELVKNYYYLDIYHILEKIDENKFKLIYDKLNLKENKFNQKFNFYFFIKICEYFENNLSLLEELNKVSVNDELITNLSLAINRNDYVNYNELVNYKNLYLNKLESSKLSVEDRLFKLIVNGNRIEVEKFLNNIVDLKKIIYLQLEFDTNTNEYQLLELYLSIVNLLEKVCKNEVNVHNIYNEFDKKSIINPLFDLKVMQENILRIYAKVYQKMEINKETLRKKGKCERINNSEIYNIDGEDFVFYVHTENFNSQEDSTELIENDNLNTSSNYLCTSFASELFPYGLNRTGMQVYTLSNLNSLIAFGNKDIFINHYPQKPLFKAENQFINPIDMAFIHGGGYTPTEFDFLRYDDNNNCICSSYITASNMEDAKRLAVINGSSSILIFDETKHLQYLENKFQKYLQNIQSLSYKDLYKLIAMSTKFTINDNFKEGVINRINQLSQKEQIVLNDALEKYKFYVKTHNK